MNIIQLRRALLSSLILFFVIFCTFANASSNDSESTVTVSGIVRDAHTKEPISAAQINALNYASSATTDEKGAFTITVSTNSDVLIVKAFDYDRREYPVRGRNDVKVDLYKEAFTDKYYDVNSDRGKVRNSEISSSLSYKTNFENVDELTVDEIIQTSLAGDVRSLQRSATAGIGNSMFIRGLNSLERNAQPLFVVDGVIWHNAYNIGTIQEGYYNNPLSLIDVNDIESLQVLKDATAIYGSKGANGVILIKTKRAADVVTKINANMTWGVTSEPTDIPVMGVDDYKIYLTEILKTDPDYSAKEVNYLSYLNNDNPSDLLYNKYHNNTDWADEVYRKGKSQSYNINVRGGDTKAKYYFSLSYASNDGVIKNTSMERLGTRMNADFKLSEIIDLSVNLNFTNEDRLLQDDGVGFYNSPRYLSLIKAPFLGPYAYTNFGKITTNFADDDTDNFDVLSVGNPSALIADSYNTVKRYQLNLSINPKVKLTPYLEIKDNFNVILDRTKELYFSPETGRVNRRMPNYAFIESEVANQFNMNSAIFNDAQLSYNRKIDLHKIYAIAGTRFVRDNFEADFAKGYNTGSVENYLVKAGLDELNVESVTNYSKTISNYLNVNYSYNNKYLVSASASIDASSKLGSDIDGGFGLMGAQWELFPSVNAAWVLSSEPFMKDLELIDFLKIRAGIDKTGNDDIPFYMNQSYFETLNYYLQYTGLALSNISNDALKWETTIRMSAGIDMALFNERVALGFDVFQSKTKDLLTQLSLPEISSFDSYWGNGGDLENKGYEASLNLKVLNLKNFRWEMATTVGHYKNEITSLPEKLLDNERTYYSGTLLTKVGNAAGVFYGYKTNGVFATTEDAVSAGLKTLNSDGTYSNFEAGDVIFEDLKKDGIINDEDRVIIGDPNPEFYGNFSTSFSFKGFKLDGLFTFSYGNDIYNFMRYALETVKDNRNQSTAVLSRWQTEGQVTNMPKAVYDDPMGNGRFSDRWIEDGSYLKLKSLKLSYNVPLAGNFIEGMNIWFAANNLWTLTDYKGADPEVSAGNSVLVQGIDRGLLPPTESYFLGIRLDL